MCGKVEGTRQDYGETEKPWFGDVWAMMAMTAWRSVGLLFTEPAFKSEEAQTVHRRFYIP